MEEEKTREFPEPEGSGTKQYLEEMQRIFAVREVLWSSIFVTLVAKKIS